MEEQLLKDYVATYLNPNYNGDWDAVNSKFPELSGVDKQLLKDYVSTYLNPKYNSDWSVVNSKFPELFPAGQPTDEQSVAEQQKKNRSSVSPFVDGGSELTRFDPASGQVVQETPEFTKPKEKDFSGLEVKVQDEKILTKQPKVERPIVSSESTEVVSPKTAEIDTSKKGAKSYLENIAVNLGLGASYANEAVASIPESIVNILAIPQNYIAEKTGLPIGVTAEGIKESWGITNPLLDYVKEDQKILSGEVSKFIADRYEDPSIVGNFEKGNYQDGFELLGSAITQSIPVSVGLMIGGAYTTPAKLATVATLGFTEDQRESLAEMNPTMSEAEKTIKAAGMAGAESVFSSIGTATIGKVYRDIAKREGAEAAKGIFKDGLVQAYKKAIEKTGVVAGFAGEGIEEAATQITQNVISGRPAFEGAADAFVTGAGSGVVFTAPVSAINAKRYIDNKVTSYDTKTKVTEILKDKANNIGQVYNVPVSSEISTTQLDIANLPNSRNLLVNDLKKSVSRGDLTEDDAKQSLFVFDKVQQVSNSVKDLNISNEDKATVATLLRQRDDLKTKIQNKDDVLVVQEKKQIEDINNQIQQILLTPQQDAIQEQAAGQVPVQPGTTVSQEVAQGEPQAEPQGITQEGQVQEEVDVFHGGSVNDIQIASIDNPLYVSESESQSAAYAKGNQGKVAKFKVDKSKIANEEEVRNVINDLGLKPKDESWSVDELNIYELIDPNFDTAMSEESINNLFEELERRGYGGAEFLGMNIETLKNDINDIVIFNPKLVTKEGQVQEVVPTQELDLDGEVSLLEQLLAEEETAPTVSAGISISSDTDVEELRNRTQSRSQQATTQEEKESSGTRLKIIDTAKRAVKTLKSIFPDIDIVVHEDEGSYNAAMLETNGKSGTKGNFFSDTTPEGKTTGRIDINLSKADGRTVAHEIAHGILIKTFGDNVNLFNSFRTRLSKVINGDANKQLNDFAAKYVDPNTGELLDVNHEEFLAELTGMLEQQETNISVTTMQKVAALINEFVSKITGGKFKPFEDTKNTKDVVDFFNTISGAIREGSEIQELNTQEPYSSGVAIPVINPNEFVGKKFRSQLDIGDYKFPSGIDILKIANLPIKTLTELVRQYEGRVVIITSDATGYGVDRNGEAILGGFGFASNEKNVSDGIGFASVSTGTVKGTYTAAEKAYGTGKTLVLVMIQPPHTTINNSYGAKYIIRGIKEIAASSKEELRKTKDAIKEFIKGSTAIQKELKNTDANFKRGSEKRLFDLIDSIDENTNLDEAVKEFLNDTTFTIRKELGKGIILENKDIRVNKSTNYSKIALNNVGYNIYDFLKEYGDNTFLDDDIILNNIGGFVVGGFELDVLPKEQREALINDIQSKGIVHPLFNAKLPGTNHFRLDALYGVQENFSEYAVPDTQISISNEERDALVRDIYKDDKFYKADARKIPLEERSYTNLTVPAKTEFKNKYLKPQGLLIEAVPNVPTKVAKGEGFIPKEGAAKQIAKGTFVSRSQLPGNDAQRIVKVGRDNGLSDQAISNVLEKRGFTQGAIDIALGKKKSTTKKAPSAQKIIGKPARKKVTVDEMASLKDQIKLEARAAREAKGDLNDKRKALSARIIAARRKGTITASQARSLVNRISRVNLDNPIMVDRLLEDIDKLFDNANYAADMAELRKLQRQAKSRNHTSMTDAVNQFTSINPEHIPLVDKKTGEPLNKIMEYKEALDFLNNRTPSYAKMNNVFDEMLSYKKAEKFDAVKTKEALKEKYKSITLNKVKNVEEYVNLIKDINSFKRMAKKLLDNEAIDQDEYNKFIEQVANDQAAVEKTYEKEISKIKRDLISEIKKQRPKTNPEFSKEENDLIRKYLELSDADLESLSPEDLFILNDLLENVRNGEIDPYRFNDVISRAYTSSGLDPLAKQINDSKFDMTSTDGRKELSENESAFWEGLLGMGRAKAGALQKFIVSPFNRAIASYENSMRKSFDEFLKIKNKYKINDEQMNKIGMLTTYLQEHMAQFDPKNKGIENIGKRDWFKEILSDKSMRSKYSTGRPSLKKMIGLGSSDIDVVEKIWKSLPKDKDGNVDPKAVYDSYDANDGKFFNEKEKAFFDDVMKYKADEITPKQKIANEINGASFKEILFHMMRVRLDGGKTQIAPTSSYESGVVRVKAGTGKERVSEAVGPIMTNFETLFIKGLEQTSRDYFLSKTLKDINNTLSGVRKKIDKDKIELLDTISYTLSDALAYEFERAESNLIFDTLLAARAAQTLLDPIRTGVELGATTISYPTRAEKMFSGYKALFADQKKMSKLLEFTDSPLRLRENINKAIDINEGKIEPQSRLTKMTTYLSGLPERTMMITSWMPTFNSEFQSITGEKFDINKFNDSSAYREKYGKAIREASAVADTQTEKIIGPTTKAGQRREIRIAPKFLASIVGREGTVSKSGAAGKILGFFSNYPYREATEFINGFKESAELIRQGDVMGSLSKLQKPLGVSLNLAAYGFLGTLAYAGQLILLGDEDDEERGNEILESLLTPAGALEELASNAASLAVSKYSAGGKALLQLAASIAIESTDDEEQKAKIKKILKNSVFVDPLPTENVGSFIGKDKALVAIARYVPQFVMLADRWNELIGTKNELKSIYDKVEKNGIQSLTKDEELQVLALNASFTIAQSVLNVIYGTSIPAYNRIKTLMKGLKEEAGVAEVYKGEAPAKKKKSSGGGGGRAKTMNKSDLKRYFPEQYNELYGKGSATYEIEQEIKAFEKEQRELKKSIKDQVYGGN